ncbi:MAG: ABC transporter permease [Opitutaceae bacterium]|nr:ABC transporter permease [Opitutaceae bacterium]
MASLRIALRSLLKSPGFTIVSLVTLALGIGVNTSMYTLVDTLLFRSAPYPEPERIVRVFATTASSQFDGFSFREIEEMRAQVSSFESLTTSTYWNNTLSEPGSPAERLLSVDSSEHFFSTFRVQPALGRAFTADEQVPGRNQVVVLSHTLWQKRFGGDPAILNRSIRLNAEPVQVIGVMPADFEYPLLWGPVDMWRPITIPRVIVEDRTNGFFGVFARLKPGATIAQAKAELDALMARWAVDHPQTSSGRGVRVVTLQQATMDSTGKFFTWMLYGLSAFVLLIACANLANLQLARATAGAKDLAIRSALGASRSRLIVHQLTECLMLSFAGGGLGLMLAMWINDVLGSNIRIGLRDGLALEMNVPIILATVLASLVAGLVFGLVPAWLASRTDVVTSLKQESRGSTAGRGHHFARQALIVAEVALALALLGGAGVMLRGFKTFLHRDAHWDTDRVVSATLHLPEQSTYVEPQKRIAAMDQMLRGLERLPGAESTAICSSLPIFGYSATRPIQVEGITSSDGKNLPQAGYTMVTPGYFKTLGIPLIEGRLFAEDIRPDSPPQIVVGQTLARQFWPGESAIGKQIVEGEGENLVRREIIGVVRDIEFPGNFAAAPTMLQIYKPFVHEPWGYQQLLVRSSTPGAYGPDLRRIVADLDPDVAVQEIRTVPEWIGVYWHNIFLVGETMAWFAALGLVLAGVGLFGVISHLVAQRTSEFGIRLALGASPGDVLRLVLRHGLTLTMIGLVIGLSLATALNVALRSFMPRTVDLDPLTLGATAAVLFTVALFAAWVPARRATKVDPLSALRAE